MFTVNFITPDDNRFQTVKDIRLSVFVNEQGANSNEEFDSYDEYGMPSTFAILYDDNDIAATGRLVLLENGYKIGRIAVLKEYRGKGYGAVVVKTMLIKAFSMGAGSVKVDAQLHAVGFYEKIGFKINGEEFFDRGLKHIPMIIKSTELCTCGGNNGKK